MALVCTIIVPIERHKAKRLAQLLEMFRENAVRSHSEIEEVMPKSTFYELLYKLRLIERLVEKRYGFRLFSFRQVRREDGSRAKVMEAATEMQFEDVDGNLFVTFSKKLLGGLKWMTR